MIKRIIRVMKRDGISLFLIRVLAKILRAEIGYPFGYQAAKNKVWQILEEKYGLIIAYGPFKGMKLSDDIWWSKNDRITQMLGIYEEHILERLKVFSTQGATRFVDIGAADGYFAIGMAYSKIYSKVVAFEIESFGQNKIRENATINHCSNVVSVFGEADYSSLKNLLSADMKTAILVDIEGAEYQLLDEEMLSILSSCYLICELHPLQVDDGYQLQRKLIERAAKKFNVELIKRESYSPNIFPELDDLSDEERLIAVGEGRGTNMQWLVLTPLQS
jgi:predicted O-methyltransferase YrrM